MRRNATKVAAVVMSLAVTMTSVNLPTTAAAATKKVKLNKTKATLTVGKTTTLKVTKGGKAVKATFKSNKPKIAKVVKKSGKSTKIKALKKGTATITATYAKKKYKCKITVKAKKVVKPTTAPTVAPTAEPTLVPTTAPATDDAFATKENVETITLKLTNAYNDKHTDTVLVGTNANIEVTALDKNGKPVANAPITLSDKEIIEDGYSSKNLTKTIKNGYENLTLPTLTTDANGHATFVFGLAKTKDDNGVVDAMRTDHTASYKLTATVAGSNKAANVTVKFAALAIMPDNKDIKKKIAVVNKYDKKEDRGEVREGLSYGDSLATTTAITEYDEQIEYVSREQVSTADKDNSVTFSTAPYLIIPSDQDETKAGKISHPVDKTFGKGYTNYKDETLFTEVVSEVDASELQYATVNFGDINISKHTKIELEARLLNSTTQNFDDGAKIVYVGNEAKKTINGTDETDVKENKGSWQINLTGANGYLAVRAKLVSKGQVNLNNNNGITVKDIVGVYNKGVSATKLDYEFADGVKIDWSCDTNVNYTIAEKLASQYEKQVVNKINEKKSEADKFNEEDFTYKYSVPAYPNTGNAIITVYNKKGQVYTYYSAKTVNNEANVNVLDDDNGITDGGLKGLNELSEAETKQIEAKLTPNADSTRVTVDSTKTGVSHIVGKITSTNSNIVIDESNDRVYTSVHWNPIENKAKDKVLGYAFKGQNVKVTAQLKDVNGNDVNVAGQTIRFNCKDVDGNAKADIKENENLGNVKVVSRTNDGKTNTKGQVEIVFACETSDVRALIQDLEAVTDSYNVTFTLNGKDTDSKKIDLYWLDLNLNYDACANGETTEDKGTFSKDDVTANVAAVVGSKWSYGVEVKATGIKIGTTTYTTNVKSGVETKVSVEDGNVGTATPYNKENRIELASNQNGSANTMFQIVPNSITDAVDVEFKNGDTVKTGYYVGVSSTTIDKRLRLNVSWGRDQIAEGKFILPTGRYVANNDNLVAYFKLVDKYNNPVTGQSVEFKATDNAGLDKTTATTDDKGMVKLTVAKGDSKTTILSAKVDGTTYTQSYEWRPDDNGFRVSSYGYNPDKKQLTIKFNDEVVANSITKDMLKDAAGDRKDQQRAIKFYGVAGGTFKSFNAKEVTVSGKVVTITLPDTFNETIANESQFVIDFNNITIDGIDYEITSAETGAKLADVDKVLVMSCNEF